MTHLSCPRDESYPVLPIHSYGWRNLWRLQILTLELELVCLSLQNPGHLQYSGLHVEA